jgi:DNA uptake protein ComE-like DNA-binding protein
MTRQPAQKGLILLIVLWMMVVLAILGTSYYHLSTLEFLTTKNDLDKFEAELLAESALYMAFADLTEESTKGYTDLSGDWAGAGQLYEEATLGKGLFQIYTDDVYSEEGGTCFGLRDENSKLNINTATKEMIQKLPGMNAARAAAIIDWRDADSEVTRGGAEQEYYSELTPPITPRNGPFVTLEELLMVKNITPRRLYGEDANRDGILQTAENDRAKNDPPDNGDGKLDRGLLPYITIYSYEKNVNAKGEKRLNINTATAEQLKERLKGKVPDTKIDHLITAREKKKVESVVDLVADTGKSGSGSEDSSSGNTKRKKGGGGKRKNKGNSRGGESESASAGAKSSTSEAELPAEAMLTEDEFKEACDDITTDDSETLPGVVNVNTAPKEVLLCLPGMTDSLAESILARRGADQQAFASTGELISLEGMNLDTFKGLYPLVSVRSNVFEARAVGYLSDSKAYASIQAVIDRSGTTPKFLYYRTLR